MNSGLGSAKQHLGPSELGMLLEIFCVEAAQLIQFLSLRRTSALGPLVEAATKSHSQVSVRALSLSANEEDKSRAAGWKIDLDDELGMAIIVTMGRMEVDTHAAYVTVAETRTLPSLALPQDVIDRLLSGGSLTRVERSIFSSHVVPPLIPGANRESGQSRRQNPTSAGSENTGSGSSAADTATPGLAYQFHTASTNEGVPDTGSGLGCSGSGAGGQASVDRDGDVGSNRTYLSWHDLIG